MKPALIEDAAACLPVMAQTEIRTSAHGFHADYRPSYRKAEARDGWQRMLRWFETMQ